MTKKQFINQIARQAIRMKIGGFRPTDNPLASWIGKVLVANPEEGWPHYNGKPMLPLCQINLNEFSTKPQLINDIAFITIFMDTQEIPADHDLNGSSWCLRAYKTTETLAPLLQEKTLSPIKPMPMVPEIIAPDFPHWDDCPIPVPATFEDNYYELFPNATGIKFGGWPTLIQGEISWNAGQEVSIQPQFAFQVDSVAKARWQWGDNGVAYFGRGTKPGTPDAWAFAWQSY